MAAGAAGWTRSGSQAVPLSALNPKFLHTNSTSHTWPFSAIAELIDNAYDPDVNAKQIWIDKTLIKKHICLTFTDNGHGMNADKLYKMLSFGFSDKDTINGHVPVGLYGNGFKSGSMRLGKDAMVFTKNGDSFSVGVLSQSYLEAIKAEHVLVPIITFNQQKKLIQNNPPSLKAILQYSLFNTEKELLAELEAIPGKRGTKIIIWNIRKTNDGKPEFDFEANMYDFRIPEDILDENNGSKKYKRQERMDHIVPESDYSLRAYCSILYLRPRMQIIIRGTKVKTQLISKSLAHIEHDLYRPSFFKPIKIIFGFNWKIKEHYGIMMYHKNRLIKAYEKVGCQLRANNMGVGVIGVIACDFLKPTHNKQDFDYTNEYRLTISAVGQKLNDYWYEKKNKRNLENPQSCIPVEDVQKAPDQVWVQCDGCLKWRKLPDGINSDKLPEKWFCSNNPDPQFRNCSVAEEPEDICEIIPSYNKTYKKQEQKNREKNRQKSLNPDTQKYLEEQLRHKEQELEEEKKRQQFDSQQNADLQNIIQKISQEAESLRKEQALLQQRLQAKNFQVNPATTRSAKSVTDENLGINAEAATTSDAVSISPVSNLQIVDVKSLSAECQSTKRKITYEDPSPSSKRLKMAEGRNLSTSSNEEIVDCLSGEDDLFILEEKSTPRPKLTLDLTKVKVEQRESMDKTGFVRDQSDSDVQEVTNNSEKKSSGTQTGNMSVKKEVSSKNLQNVGQNPPNSKVPDEDADNRSKQDKLQNDDALHCAVEERDRFKAESELLQKQLEQLKIQLAEQSMSHVKRESCHQWTQCEFEIIGDKTEEIKHFCQLPTEEQTSRYELALTQIERLTDHCEGLEDLKTECFSDPELKGDEDELILQLDNVFRQLDSCMSERDCYKAEAEKLQKETEAMTSQNENLTEEVNRLKDEAMKAQSNLSEDPSTTLQALRINVGQLLVNIVPELDLQQINYESNVVDEILDQVLTANAS